MKKKVVHFYTDGGLDVTEWIKLGKTFLFDNLFEARAMARKIHSYLYEVHDNRGIRVGWGVPK